MFKNLLKTVLLVHGLGVFSVCCSDRKDDASLTCTLEQQAAPQTSINKEIHDQIDKVGLCLTEIKLKLLLATAGVVLDIAKMRMKLQEEIKRTEEEELELCLKSLKD